MRDLYGGDWAIVLYRDGPQLLQVQGGDWAERDDAGALADLPGARHVSLAFDQAARPVLAWEVSGTLYVRQWDGQGGYVTRGPFPGRQPLLTTDALLLLTASDSDVLLYHLDGGSVICRTQRDLYGVPRVAATVPAGSVLDQITASGGRLQLIGEAPGGERLVLASELYPLRLAHTARAAGALVGGVLRGLSLLYPGASEVRAGGELSRGALVDRTPVTSSTDGAAAGADLTAGRLRDATAAGAAYDALRPSVTLRGALRTLVFTVRLNEQMTAGAGLSGGTLK